MSISWLQLLSKRLLLDFFLVSASQVMITDSINMFFYFFSGWIVPICVSQVQFFFLFWQFCDLMTTIWIHYHNRIPTTSLQKFFVALSQWTESPVYVSSFSLPFPQWNQDFWEWNADIHGLFQVFSVDFSEKHFRDWGTNSILPNTILLSSSVTLGGEVKSNCQTLYFSPNILCLTRDLESRYSAIFRSSGLVDDSDQQLLFWIHESLRATEPRNV